VRRIAYPRYDEQTVTGVYIPPLMDQTPANKSQEDEQGAEGDSDCGACDDSGHPAVTGMLHEIVILFRGGCITLVAHGQLHSRRRCHILKYAVYYLGAELGWQPGDRGGTEKGQTLQSEVISVAVPAQILSPSLPSMLHGRDF
jgi:hypothetical protein